MFPSSLVNYLAKNKMEEISSLSLDALTKIKHEGNIARNDFLNRISLHINFGDKKLLQEASELQKKACVQLLFYRTNSFGG